MFDARLKPVPNYSSKSFPFQDDERRLVVVGSASAAREDIRHNGENTSDESAPSDPESVTVVDNDAVLLLVDRVAGLGVDGCEESSANTESESGEQGDESSTEEGETVAQQTGNPCEEGEARANKDEVHGGPGVVTEVLRVNEGALRKEVLDRLSRILRSI